MECLTRYVHIRQVHTTTYVHVYMIQTCADVGSSLLGWKSWGSWSLLFELMECLTRYLRIIMRLLLLDAHIWSPGIRDAFEYIYPSLYIVFKPLSCNVYSSSFPIDDRNFIRAQQVHDSG